VKYIKTSLQAAHGNWDPSDAPTGDAPTCDPGDPPTWFDDAPECRCKKFHVSNKIKIQVVKKS
jgi:hypothetical protein